MWSLLLSIAASGATLEVCSNCAFQTMEQALGGAAPGDVIDVAAGDWPMPPAVDLDFDLTIQGRGASTLLKCAESSSPLVRATSGARVALFNVSVEACSSASAVEVASAEAYLENVVLKNTTTSVVLGTMLHVEGSGASAWVVDGKVDGLQTSGQAGVFSVQGAELTIQGGTYSNLQGPSLGRLVNVDAGTLNLLEATVRDATAENHGMINLTAGSNLKIDRSVFQNIQSGGAAAVKSAGGSTLVIQGSLFTGLRSTVGNGAALYSWKNDDITLAHNMFAGNSTSKNGGALAIQQPTSFKSRHSLWCDNTSEDYAGAIYGGLDSGSHFEVDHDVFLQNQSASGGGAIRLFSASGTASVSPGFSSSTFVMNHTTNGALAHQIFGSSVNIDVRKSAFFQSEGGRHVLGNPGGVIRLYDSAYATTATTIHFRGSIESGATAAVNDLNFVDLANADCSNARDMLLAQTNGVLDVDSIGALLTEDLDGDGHNSNVDCDDDDPEIHPDQDEQCDDIDHDCDGSARTSATGGTVGLDEAWRDVDGDGYGDPSNPDLRMVCPDDIIPAGWARRLDSGGPPDCDDTDPSRNPDAEELCDDGGVDANCDGDPDDGATDLTYFFADEDGDSFGDDEVSVHDCEAPSDTGWTTDSSDCDDGDFTTYPGADELCDDVDHDCDGKLIENAVNGRTWFIDDDQDNWGVDDVNTNRVACTQPSGFTSQADDCDDTKTEVHPTAEERCDSLDRNCDNDPTAGAIDVTYFYTDADGDSHGDELSEATGLCGEPGDGWSDNQDDCDDADADRHPGNTELCDTLDRNCDGDATLGATDTTPYFPDTDQDGAGDNNSASTEHCADPGPLWSLTQGDCDDSNADRYPGNTELCDVIDRNCDGDATAGATDTFLVFVDSDSDAFGAPGTGVESCTVPDGSSTIGTDCDDTSADIYPDAPEICNSVDDDCDQEIDEGCDTDSSDTADTADTEDTGLLLLRPTDYTTVSGGCRTQPTGQGGWSGVLLLSLLLRRRMR